MKPDEIDQDVWDAADRIFDEIACSYDAYEAQASIARALTAERRAGEKRGEARERERCAWLARERGNLCNMLQNDNVDREIYRIKRDAYFALADLIDPPPPAQEIRKGTP